MESKKRELDERIEVLSDLVNLFLGLEPKASLEDVQERAKEIGELWKILITKKREWESLEEKKKKWFGSNGQ